jgi:hypothetical protein
MRKKMETIKEQIQEMAMNLIGKVLSVKDIQK